jgi:hypothetical protein
VYRLRTVAEHVDEQEVVGQEGVARGDVGGDQGREEGAF